MAGLWQWRYSPSGRELLRYAGRRAADSETAMTIAIAIVLTTAVVIAVCAVAIWIDGREAERG